MKQITVWFEKGYFSDEWIGVVEAKHDGNRILIHEKGTIAKIERNIAKILPKTT